MSGPVLMPDESALRDFLLGKLSAERAEEVAARLSSHPGVIDALAAVAADDALTRTLADSAAAEAIPSSTVDWVVRSVLQELGGGETPSTDAAHATPELPGKALAGSPPLTTKLGPYRVVREIGRGGMGIVLEADDEELQRRVAIKVMNSERAQDPAVKARFLREARAAAAIDHENVVAINHVGEDGGVPFIVMPLLRGETLESRLKREGRLAAEEVVRVGREVLAGLAAAHARGLVHRDIKPANIWLVAETGKVKILDFGLARAADGTEGLTVPGAMPGTPGYMAPEQVDGQPADARSDLFSVGATLYRCATGQTAFAGPTLSAVLRAVTDHDPLPPHAVNPAVPGPLSDLILRLLAKAPAARPPSAQHVLHDLAHFDESPTLTDRRRPPPTARRRWLPISCSVTITIAAAATVLLAMGLPLLFVAHKRPEYRGQVDVLVERADADGKIHLLRLNEAGALPLRQADKFRIEGRVDPPAYLYVVWVDPGHDITPVYPWDPKVGWGSRPTKEEPTGTVSLPPNAANRYTAPDAKPGVATIVLFARPTPLDAPDDQVRTWFEGLPDLRLPPGGEQAAVWFDNYVEVHDPDRPRTFGEVGSDDAFARWQGQLQKVLGGKAAFQTAVSFARTGGK